MLDSGGVRGKSPLSRLLSSSSSSIGSFTRDTFGALFGGKSEKMANRLLVLLGMGGGRFIGAALPEMLRWSGMPLGKLGS